MLKNIGESKIYISNGVLGVIDISNWTVLANSITNIYKVDYRWGHTRDLMSSWIELNVETIQWVQYDPSILLCIDIMLTVKTPTYQEYPIINIVFQIDKEWTWIEQNNYINPSNFVESSNDFFKPYNYGSIVNVFNQLSTSISNIYGHDVAYFRSNPQKSSADIVLREWTLYEVEEQQCIKAIVPNNDFGEQKIAYNTLGIDYEGPFEVHIVRGEFEKIWGYGNRPQKRDILYFPIVNRLYEVDSSHINNLIPTHFQVMLIKYNPTYNRKESNDLSETFNVLTTGFEKEFGKEIKDLSIKTTNPQQFSQHIGNNNKSDNLDPIRDILNPDIIITNTLFQNYSNIISHNQYDLRSIQQNNYDTTRVIKYKYNENIQLSNNRCFQFWYKPLSTKTSPLTDAIVGNIQVNDGIINCNIKGIRNYNQGDCIIFKRFNKSVFFATILDCNIVDNYTSIRLEVDYPINIKIYDYYTIEKSLQHDILTLGDDNIVLSIIEKSFIVQRAGANMWVTKIDLLENWYGFFFNMSNTHRQWNIDIWERTWTEENNIQSKELKKIHSSVAKMEYVIADGEYSINSGSALLSNIRIWNILEYDNIKQQSLLNQNIVIDPQFALVIDNAKPILTLPYIANTK
jgi:hypothetical protein